MNRNTETDKPHPEEIDWEKILEDKRRLVVDEEE